MKSFPDRPPSHSRPAPAVVEADGTSHFEVESILASRGRGNRKQYLVHWKGYPLWESTWESSRALQQAPDAIRAFEHATAPTTTHSIHTIHLVPQSLKSATMLTPSKCGDQLEPQSCRSIDSDSRPRSPIGSMPGFLDSLSSTTPTDLRRSSETRHGSCPHDGTWTVR